MKWTISLLVEASFPGIRRTEGKDVDNNKQLLDEVEHDIMNIYYYSKSQVKEECCDTRQINLDR